ncbi:Lrp/AsnC ligand binding domain-containing protein [Halorussus gelatinilyticus]|uniref:Lrp/AsnC ligand binding domain-containing protein n=1 Tax=Halorussus gelatinilyticus TaxID=2937524 RepID=A0A8U0IKX0_9EURY|nr:Lrp/AsnC ligand binding domain-containing protein [Halorussus gelatinilyticus]UPW00972.1 Lrp/AsnC ligand binding domain-containing protein [Halorussus gelatinilyticus]
MVHAFVMVKTAAGRSEDVLAAVRELDRISEAHVVAGEFDVIAEAEADEVYDVLQTASSDISGMDGVADTKTYMALD